MRAFGVRLPVVLASMAAVLTLLFGAQYLYTRQALSLPLNARIERIGGVIGAPSVVSGALGLEVRVRLGLVNDLQSTYHSLQRVVRAGVGGHRVAVRIVDSRTPQLVAAYRALSPILDQGRATGRFVRMEQEFSAASAKLGLTRAVVTVDNAHMYIELVARSHYLYEIMPLTLAAPTPAPGTGAA